MAEEDNIIIILSTASDLPSDKALLNGIILAKDNKVISTAIWAINLLLFLTPLFSNNKTAPIPTGIKEVAELDSK